MPPATFVPGGIARILRIGRFRFATLKVGASGIGDCILAILVGFALLLNMLLLVLLTDMVDCFRKRFERPVMKPLIEAVVKANIVLEEIL
jgi:uncharacterized membrane protein